jgi:hypothetical protein
MDEIDEKTFRVAKRYSTGVYDKQIKGRTRALPVSGGIKGIIGGRHGNSLPGMTRACYSLAALAL